MKEKIRVVARVVGLLVATIPAVEMGKLHYRRMEKVKIKALEKNYMVSRKLKFVRQFSSEMQVSLASYFPPPASLSPWPRAKQPHCSPTRGCDNIYLSRAQCLPWFPSALLHLQLAVMCQTHLDNLSEPSSSQLV
ncbi:hypothetical protein E2C01_050831 [Portunus trituberculatus]|uniref:Uncharacterized protein n=1 Tax=Portunus trituberculatus TaxID=210409 RepID=A0A5B7GHE3_PORTR|nr:hypothetical protein [Portunus trituberculatus]